MTGDAYELPDSFASEDEAEAEMRFYARTVAAPRALKAAVELCDDPKAAAGARATAQRTVLQAAGVLDADTVKAKPKEPHEMTPSELDAVIDQARARLATAEQVVTIDMLPAPAAPPATGIFD